jgi:hypothetical protein
VLVVLGQPRGLALDQPLLPLQFVEQQVRSPIFSKRSLGVHAARA